jgi:translation initiation factor IF-1
MSKESIIVEGRVSDCLPNAMFRVNVKIGGSDNHTILAHLSGKIRINNINILEGDLVKIEMSPYDLTRGRITYRFKE